MRNAPALPDCLGTSTPGTCTPVQELQALHDWVEALGENRIRGLRCGSSGWRSLWVVVNARKARQAAAGPDTALPALALPMTTPCTCGLCQQTFLDADPQASLCVPCAESDGVLLLPSLELFLAETYDPSPLAYGAFVHRLLDHVLGKPWHIGSAWVCEAHPHLPYPHGGPDGCECPGPGMPPSVRRGPDQPTPKSLRLVFVPLDRQERSDG